MNKRTVETPSGHRCERAAAGGSSSRRRTLPPRLKRPASEVETQDADQRRGGVEAGRRFEGRRGTLLSVATLPLLSIVDGLKQELSLLGQEAGYYSR
jgi:hypothetical protein